MSRGRRVAAVCGHCADIFTRRLHDFLRHPDPVCSTRCRDARRATGPTMVSVQCSGCGVEFQKLASEMRRRRSLGHYCSSPCYLAHVDLAALGAAGGRSAKFVDPEVARARSRAGGFARAQRLSPERLREIAMLGVAARLALPPEERRRRVKRAMVTRRFGAGVLGVRLGRR